MTTTPPPSPPLSLKMKAPIWRFLMKIGMKFHHYADPKPPKPSFKIIIPSRLSPSGGTFKLVFYVPDSYLEDPAEEYRFPVVVNFHGGGFTLGTGTDDARWGSSVVNHVDAVFVSVEYRLAPEYPFSVGVEDGTDALIYLAAHAEELRLDPHRIAISGFSAGGNFAFTVPLMLYDLQQNAGKRAIADRSNNYLARPRSSHHQSGLTHKSASTLSLPQMNNGRTRSANSSTLKLTDLEPTILEMEQQIPDLTIKCIVSFYPPTDFRTSRQEKRATNPQPEMNLPPMLTNLFDASYLRANGDIDMSDPYLSPAAADDTLLADAYPDDIVLYTCEYDMLNVEGVHFGERLGRHPINKRLHGGLIKGVPHAFDKKPNPLSFPVAADKCYAEACAELVRVFGGRSSVDERRQLEEEYHVERFEAEIPEDTVIGEHDQEDEEDPKGKGIQRRRSSMSNYRSKWSIHPLAPLGPLGPVPGPPPSPSRERRSSADIEEARRRPTLKKQLTEVQEEYAGPSEAAPAPARGRKTDRDNGFAFGRGASTS